MPSKSFRKIPSRATASDVTQDVVDTIKRNQLLVLLAIFCLIDAALAIAGFATHSPWLMSLESEKDGVKKYALNALGVAHVAGWAVGPPSWFFFETVFLQFRLLPTGSNLEDPARKAALERLKLKQDLGAKIWAAVLAAILFLATR